MSGRLFAVATVGLLVAAAGLAVLAGVVSLPGYAAGPAASPNSAASSDAGDSTTPSGDLSDGSDGPFTLVVERIERCGRTCRDVTTNLTNRQPTAASNVEVRTRIYAGNSTDGNQVWSGEESVGTLGAGESYATVKRVKLGLSDALAVERNDGWITVETTIRSDSGAITVVERREVA
ncbi:MAG: hypothetical protein V5A44_03110 [Haloarculaceae archaeon]